MQVLNIAMCPSQWIVLRTMFFDVITPYQSNYSRFQMLLPNMSVIHSFDNLHILAGIQAKNDAENLIYTVEKQMAFLV